MAAALPIPLARLAAALSLGLCVAVAGAHAAGGGEDKPGDPDFAAGVAAVHAQQWPVVIERMNAVVQREPRNADAWNYLGYAHRHLGDMESSFRDYEKALQIDPRHRGAHEYAGEAWLQVDQPARAEEHLKALDKLCWLPCEEYRDLKAKIDAYKRAHASAG